VPFVRIRAGECDRTDQPALHRAQKVLHKLEPSKKAIRAKVNGSSLGAISTDLEARRAWMDIVKARCQPRAGASDLPGTSRTASAHRLVGSHGSPLAPRVCCNSYGKKLSVRPSSEPDLVERLIQLSSSELCFVSGRRSGCRPGPRAPAWCAG